MSRALLLLLSLSLVGALGGCDLPPGSNDGSEGLEALQAAREKADAARYLVALDIACCDRDGNPVSQRLLFATRLTQISQDGRVVLWQRLAPGGAGRESELSYSLRHGRGCYDATRRGRTAVAIPVATGPDVAPPGPTAPTGRRAPRRPHLIGPRAGALVRPGRPPLLRWTPVRGARYYNLQLWRRGRKILSVWPARPRYQLKGRWKFGGGSWRLEPGRYRWFVWPGFGPRSKADYGRRLGPGRFRVGPPRPR